MRSAVADSTSNKSDASESEDDEVLVSEEEQEEVHELAFEKLITSALEQSRYA